MPKARPHSSADCYGTLIRVYQRPERSGAVVPFGYVCSACRQFIPDEVAVTSIAEFRPAAEAVANEISRLVLDSAVHERFAGIVRSNDALLTAAQGNNPFLNGVRRWWATTTALTLRRHLDPGGTRTLRSIVEYLAADDPHGDGAFAADLEVLDRLRERFGPHFNALIHTTESSSSLTYAELSAAVDTVRAIGERAYAAVTNVSRRMNPVVQFDWTAIFQEPWLPSNVEMAYDLGTPGVPYDALPMTRSSADSQASLEPSAQILGDGSASVCLKNIGVQSALDVRLFLPMARTVIDVPELRPGETVMSTPVRAGLVPEIAGQIVIEFADLRENVFRQYADVSLASTRLRNLSGPFHVTGRIVAPQAHGVA